MARRFDYTEPDWKMEDVPVGAGFDVDVTRCGVAEFFESFGMSDVCERHLRSGPRGCGASQYRLRAVRDTGCGGGSV